MESPLADARQAYLLEETTMLDASFWQGSFNGRESTLQQVAPYVGKMKSGMAHVLVRLYSRPGDTVLDPFSGSGVVPLECVLADRRAWANDLSPYGYALTRAKLEAPGSETSATAEANDLADYVEVESGRIDVSAVPDWVKEFFHPQTLAEILAALDYLEHHPDYFLLGCLLGILHHVRPGFLSYPASHLVPYLRKNKYPPEEFPEMYGYRDVRSRLLAKVRRMYKRHQLPVNWEQRQYQVWQVNAMQLPVNNESVGAIISSPPYYGALDYARDNRLRLWFLGCQDWKKLDSSLTASSKVYLPQMQVCLAEMERVLKTGGHCVLVLGDVERDGKTHRTAEVLADLATQSGDQRFSVETIYDDIIPDERRSRRGTRTTKFERILVMKKN